MRKVGGGRTSWRWMNLSTQKKSYKKKHAKEIKNQETWRCLASYPEAVNRVSTSVTKPGSTATKQYCPQSKKNTTRTMTCKKHANTCSNQGSDVIPVVLNGPMVTTIHHDIPKIGKGPFAISLSDPQLYVASHLCDNGNLKSFLKCCWEKVIKTNNPCKSKSIKQTTCNVIKCIYYRLPCYSSCNIFP